jgi:hypothetical protein
MIKMIFYLFLFSMSIAWSQTSGDVDVVFKNMMTPQDISRCDVCANFYRVDTFHKFIGVKLSKTCEGVSTINYAIYGMIDVSSDLSNFRRYLDAGQTRKLRFINRMCGMKLYRSLEMAKNVSNDALMMARFIATPFFGRPCKNIAMRIEMKLKSENF